MSAPETSFYVTGGTLRHDAPSYVERQADRDVFEGLLAGEFCYVLTPRQMGKSSLMVRTASKLREQGVNVIALDLTAIGQNLTPEQWYDGVAARMGRQLRLDEELERFWRAHERLGPCQRLFSAIRDVVLLHRPGPLVIFVDEIDSVRSLPFSTDELFAAMRECYNRRAEDPELNRVTFCLLGVATPSDLIRDTRTTPFNIGRRIELHDFTRVEAAPLAQGLRDTVTPDDRHSSATAGGNAASVILTSGRLLTRILYWTGGHPYLTQRFCRAVVEDASMADATGVDRICEDLFLSSRARERDDNLLFVRERLLRSETDLSSLLEHYRKVRRGEPVPDDETSRLVSVLRLSGIVASEEGFLRERNRIYSRVFDEEWIRAHLPEAELRRQRAAFYRGVFRTTAIAAVVVAALTVTVVIAIGQAKKARVALAHSYFSHAKTRRVSGMAGQRYESLEALRQARSGSTNDAALRDEAIACLALEDLRLDFVRAEFPDGATAVALSPGLDFYAVGDNRGAISVMRPGNDQVVGRLAPSGIPVSWLAMDPDGRFVAAQYSDDGHDKFALWNLAAGQAVLVATNVVHPGAIDFSPDGALVAAVVDPGVVDIISLSSLQRVARLPLRQATNTPRDPVCVRFDKSGRRLVEAAPGSQRAQIWNLADQSVTNWFLPSEISALAWSPDDNHLAAAGVSGLALWDLKSARPRLLAQSEADVVLDMAFNPAGTLLAALGANRTLRLWCPSTGRHVTESLPGEAVGRIHFTADGRRLGVAGLRTGVRIWQVLGGGEYRVYRASTEFYAPLHRLAFDPEGRLLIGASDLGAFFWDTATGRALPALPMQSIRCLFVHPGTGDLFTSGPQGLFRLSRRVVAVGSRIEYSFGTPRSFDLPSGLEACSLAHEATQATVVHADHMHAFHVDEPNTLSVFPFRSDWKALALSPDGRWLAAWSETNNQIQVRGTQQTNTADRPVLSVQAGRHFAFTPDSRFLLTGLAQSNQLWSTETWTATASFGELSFSGGENAPIAFARLSAAGTVLFAISDETSTIRLYEMTGGTASNTMPDFRLLARLEAPDRKRVSSLTFNPQGNRLAAATAVQTVQVWDLAGIQRGLESVGLADSFTGFANNAFAPLTISFDTMETSGLRANDWSKVCKITFDLMDTAPANSAARVEHLVNRAKVYLDLGRTHLAKADLEEALGLKPDDARIAEMLDRVRGRTGSPQPNSP